MEIIVSIAAVIACAIEIYLPVIASCVHEIHNIGPQLLAYIYYHHHSTSLQISAANILNIIANTRCLWKLSPDASKKIRFFK